MDLLDKFTQAIAGKTTCLKAHQKALEKHYEDCGTEEYMRQVTSTAPEVCPAPVERRDLAAAYKKATRQWQIASQFKNPFFWAITPSEQPDLVPSNNDVKTQPIPGIVSYPTDRSADPPVIDLKAVNTNLDASKHADVPNDASSSSKTQPILMARCRGIGRYCVAVSASPEFQAEHLRNNLSTLMPHLVDQLADTDLAKAFPDAWSEQMSEYGSKAALPASDPYHESRDPVTGTLVIRGFKGSKAAATANNPKNGILIVRKDSGSSMLSPIPGKRVLSNNSWSRVHSNSAMRLTTPSPLRTIREMEDTNYRPVRKIEMPCVFDQERGDPDSAVASEDEDEAGHREDEWVDVIEMRNTGRRASGLTRLVENSKRSVSASRPAPLVRVSSHEIGKSRSGLRKSFNKMRAPRDVRQQLLLTHPGSPCSAESEPINIKKDTKEATSVVETQNSDCIGGSDTARAKNGTSSGHSDDDHSSNTSLGSGVWLPTHVSFPGSTGDKDPETVSGTYNSSPRTTLSCEPGELTRRGGRERSNTAFRIVPERLAAIVEVGGELMTTREV